MFSPSICGTEQNTAQIPSLFRYEICHFHHRTFQCLKKESSQREHSSFIILFKLFQFPEDAIFLATWLGIFSTEYLLKWLVYLLRLRTGFE